MNLRSCLYLAPFIISCGNAESTQNPNMGPSSASNHVQEIEQRVADLEATVQSLTRLIEVTKASDQVKINGDLIVDGGNLQVQNGTGSTAEEQNGKGNIIIGYNEEPTRDIHGALIGERTGSHNLIVGMGHTFVAHSGIISGKENYLSSNHAAIIAGQENTIRDFSGMGDPTRTGENSVILGGFDNDVTSEGCGVLTSQHSKCTNQYGMVIGGEKSRADAPFAMAIGGSLITLEGSSNIAIGGKSTRLGSPNTIAIGAPERSDFTDGKVHINNSSSANAQ